MPQPVQKETRIAQRCELKTQSCGAKELGLASEILHAPRKAAHAPESLCGGKNVPTYPWRFPASSFGRAAAADRAQPSSPAAALRGQVCTPKPATSATIRWMEAGPQVLWLFQMTPIPGDQSSSTSLHFILLGQSLIPPVNHCSHLCCSHYWRTYADLFPRQQ